METRVYLVGAGPGDPGLITVKGRACIRRADVLIYDYLASPALLKFARPSAERIYVGKKGGDHTLSQTDINALIVAKAQPGAVVTRLKGGDPFIFGRGGEEAEVLREAGIPYEVVPGVTSAIAAPAYAGIPLTHRDFTSTLAFVTGHEDPSKAESSIDWGSLAKGIGTLVFLMGIKNLPQITRQLMAHGMLPETPVAVVRWGTTSRQITLEGRLDDIVARVQAAGLKAPAIVVVGKVVTLRRALKWFETRPLFGKTVVVTRAREQSSDLLQRFSDLGAECIECPTIRVVPPREFGRLDAALERLSSYDWLIFTSVNGVRSFFERLFAQGLDARALHRLRTAVIGPATADKLRACGLRSDILPDSYRAEAIVQAFATEDLKGKRVLLPRASEARPLLPQELSRLGAVVDEVPVYRTEIDRQGTDLLVDRLAAGTVDLVTFTSSSTVRNFKALLPPTEIDGLLRRVVVACIGPITAATAREMGFEVHIESDVFTIPGLCRSILDYYRPAPG